MDEDILEFKGVAGSQRRITVPRTYVVAYELWEGELVKVHLYNAKNFGNSDFLARVQKGFRIQIPSVEYKELQADRRSILEIKIQKAKKKNNRIKETSSSQKYAAQRPE